MTTQEQNIPPDLDPLFSLTALLAKVGLSILLIALLFHSWYGPDIWFHLQHGKQVLAAGNAQPPKTLMLTQANYINIYWLFQIICYGIYSIFGTFGISTLFAALWVGILGIWFKVSQGGKWLAVSLPALLVSILIFKHRFDQRPEVFSFLFLSLQIWILEKWDPEKGLDDKNFWGYVLIEVLWANMHSYFILGFLPIIARIVSSAFQESRPFKSLFPLLGACSLATVLSPVGLGTWSHVIAASQFLKLAHNMVQELSPPVGIALARYWTLWFFWIGWFCALGGISLLLMRKTKNLYPLFMAAGGMVIGAASFKNIPLFVIFSGPLWAELISYFKSKPVDLPIKHQIAITSAVAAFSTILGIWTIQGGFYRSLGTPADFGPHISNIAFPTKFGDYLAKSGFQGSVFNGTSGGYLQFHFPQLKVFMDTAFSDYGAASSYFQALQDVTEFNRFDQQYHFDSALLKVNEDGNLILALLKNPDWEMDYADLHFVFLVKRKSPAVKSLVSWRRFYSNEDLSFIPNGQTAVLWLGLLREAGKIEWFAEASKQFSKATQLPAGVIGMTLEYGLQSKNKELVLLGRDMFPRIYRPDRRQVEVLQQLARQAQELISPPNNSSVVNYSALKGGA